MDINSKQVAVKRILLDELYSNLNHGSEDPIKRHEAQYPRIVMRLDKIVNSPFKDRIRLSEKEKSFTRCLNLNSFVDGIRENKLLGTVSVSAKNVPLFQAGPLTHASLDFEETAEKAVDVLIGYFNVIAKTAFGNWNLGDAKGGYLSTNNGVRALLRLLSRLISFVEARDHVASIDLSADDIVTRVEPFVRALAEYMNAAQQTEVQAFRQRQALAGVTENCKGMMAVIAESVPEFTSPELAEYLNSRDKEGTKIAGQLLFEINDILFRDVIQTLKNHHGSDGDKWWWNGIPAQVRAMCDESVNRDNGAKERWRYLSLANYQTIVSQPQNWQFFSERYDFTGRGKAVDRVSWIGHLSKVRQTTHHPEKGVISKDEVRFVKETYTRVKRDIEPSVTISI